MLESSAALVTARPSKQQLEMAGCAFEGFVRVAKTLDINAGDCHLVFSFVMVKGDMTAVNGLG
jgi:hypothetical protein